MAYKPKVLEVQAGGTGLSSISTGSLIYASSTNTFSALASSEDGSIVQDYNGVPTSSNPNSRFWFYDDTMSLKIWDNSDNSGASCQTKAISAGNPGCIRMRTGSVPTANTTLYIPANDGSNQLLELGGGVFTYQTLVYLSALSTAGQNQIIFVGLNNSNGSLALDNNVTFKYDATISANWIILTSISGGSSTSTTTSVAVAATTWTKLKFVVNAAASSVQFFINGSSVGTITTNIPTGPILCRYIIKSDTGTTSYDMYVDYCEMNYLLTTPR